MEQSTWNLWGTRPPALGASQLSPLPRHCFVAPHDFQNVSRNDVVSFHCRDYFGPKGCLQRVSGRLKMRASKNIHSSIWSTILGCPASRLLFLHVCGLWPQDWQPKTYWVCLGTKGINSILVLQGLYSPCKKSRILQCHVLPVLTSTVMQCRRH